MFRKWITPVASLALLAGLSVAPSARADDAPTTAPSKATITVKVVDGDGKAVAGATVDLMTAPTGGGKRSRSHAPAAGGAAPAPAGGGMGPNLMSADPADPAAPAKPKRGRNKPLQTVTTDADGAATLKDVADGSYQVAARLKGSGAGREKVKVADGKSVSVTVTIKPHA